MSFHIPHIVTIAAIAFSSLLTHYNLFGSSFACWVDRAHSVCWCCWLGGRQGNGSVK